MNLMNLILDHGFYGLFLSPFWRLPNNNHPIKYEGCDGRDPGGGAGWGIPRLNGAFAAHREDQRTCEENRQNNLCFPNEKSFFSLEIEVLQLV